MGQPGLEFVWVGDDAVDPLQQAQTLQILVSAGIKTREEARADLGLGGGKAGAGVEKYNSNHDERGRFSTAADAVGVVGHGERKPKPQGVQVAGNNTVRSDASGLDVAQAEPPPIEPPIEPMNPEASEPLGAKESATVETKLTIEDIASGKFPGVARSLGDPRNMPASADPSSAAGDHIDKLVSGKPTVRQQSDLDPQGGYVIRLDDGTYITYRPPGGSSERTPDTMASVDMSSPK